MNIVYKYCNHLIRTTSLINVNNNVKRSFRSMVSLDTLYPNSSLKLTTPTKPESKDGQFSGYIPIDELNITYSRSSGPGGQNVNTVNTKVDLRFNVQSASWISDEIKAKLVDKVFGILNVIDPGHVILPVQPVIVQPIKLSKKKALNKIEILFKYETNFELIKFAMPSALLLAEMKYSLLLNDDCTVVQYRTKITKDGFLVFRSDVTRSQQLNLADCLEKVRTAIRSTTAVAPEISAETQEKIRRRLERASHERLSIKRIRSDIKADRRSPTL